MGTRSTDAAAITHQVVISLKAVKIWELYVFVLLLVRLLGSTPSARVEFIESDVKSLKETSYFRRLSRALSAASERLPLKIHTLTHTNTHTHTGKTSDSTWDLRESDGRRRAH